MNEKPGEKNPPRKRIIGLLGHDLVFQIPIRIFRTIKTLAAEKDVIIYYLIAQAFNRNKKFYNQSNILYKFVSPDILDGLIIMSNVLIAFAAPEEFMENYRQFRSLPWVSLGLSLPQITSVIIDNESGVYDAVSHLIEVHHYTRIGFLTGPDFHPEALARFNAYTRAMQDHKLRINPALILRGTFHSQSAIAAVLELIENRGQLPGRDIDALVCANDYMALTVLKELRNRGYRVPEDIALVGFDDLISTRCVNPSLSTVRNPLEKITAKSLDLLIDTLDGKVVPQSVSIPTEFIPRCSCGCKFQFTGNTSMSLPCDSQSANNFYNSFTETINNRIRLSTIHQIEIWDDALTFMQSNHLWWENSHENSKTVHLAKMAFSLLGNTADNSLKSAQSYNEMNNLGILLTSTLDFPELKKILITHLPLMGIRNFCLIFYENTDENNNFDTIPPWSQTILAFYEQNGQIVNEELPAEGLRFPTYELIPRELTEKYGQKSWIVAPLYFSNEQIGFLLMDFNASNENLYYLLRYQLSSCLKSVLLLRGYQEHTRKLAEANERIHEFIRQLEDENLRIKMEMEVARSIQTALLPQEEKYIHPDFEITSYMLPATEVGGDYFDIDIDAQGHLWIGIGDVSGHGLKAGIIMMIALVAQTTITTNYDITPRDVLIMMNRVMMKTVTRRMQQEQYMTCAMLKYLNSGRFQYAGMHLNFLIYRQKTETCDEIILDGIWLNVLKNIEDKTPNLEFTLDIGDVLVLYTDGITEIINAAGQLLDIKGLKELVLIHGSKDIDDMLSGILNDLKNWSSDKNDDDMSLVLIRRIH